MFLVKDKSILLVYYIILYYLFVSPVYLKRKYSSFSLAIGGEI